MAETFTQRLKRYVDRPAVDTLGWVKVMLQNYHVLELKGARENKLYHCVYLLAHSVIQTVSEAMFGLTGLKGTHFFLEEFADGPTQDRRFSTISSEVHNVRNIIAHRGYSKTQHKVQYFIDDIKEGWRRENDGSLTINPAVYSIEIEDVFKRPALYLAFSRQSPLQLLRLKYKFVRQWLDLGNEHAITKAIKMLDGVNENANVGQKDNDIRQLIYKTYDIRAPDEVSLR
jgi:hypothetical protein